MAPKKKAPAPKKKPAPKPAPAKPAAPSGASAAPSVTDSRAALARLTGGQTLTAEDRMLLNLGPASAGTGTGTGTGGTGGNEPDDTPPAKPINAFDEVGAQLNAMGLGSLSNTYIQLMTQGFTPIEALNKLKFDTTTNPATGRPLNEPYTIRFAGNAARVKQGLNAYTEEEYLNIENSYADTLRRNNLTNLLSTDPEQNTKRFAGYMEKGLSATEFSNRIDTFFERVQNMDPNIKNQFTSYFPGINNTDIVSYLADPENTMPVLRNKITAAEIGASARRVGLSATDRSMALNLAQSGVTAAQAQVGYERIGDYLERTQFLADVYDESGIQYNQTTAEQEEFQGLASAKRKRERLGARETAAFAGESGRLRTGQPQRNTGAF